MKSPASLQQHKLYELAQKDSIYQLWAKSFEECREAFIAFANSQPDRIRNMLYGYADCGRMAQQRLVNLACDYMIFPEED